MDELKVFTGNAHPALAQPICEYLGIPLGKIDVFEFNNENIFVRILENVRQRDVFIVQPICSPVNKSLMELLIMMDAMKRASAERITAVVPYYGYGRTDKKDQPRVPITARLVADLITVAGANRLLTMDLHAGQIQGFFNIPVDELTAMYALTDYFKGKRLADLMVVATDIGISKRARDYAARLKAPLAIIEKRRVGNNDKVETLNIIGDVSGKRALLVDDEVDTAGSITNAAEALKQHGAVEVISAALNLFYESASLAKIQRQLQLSYGVKPDRMTILRWVNLYSKRAVDKLKDVPIKVGSDWVADETVLKLKSKGGSNIWFHDIIDSSSRFLLASVMSENRTTQNAQTLMEQAASRSKKIPKTVTTDRLSTYPDGIELTFGADTKHIPAKKLTAKNGTQKIERFHSTLKDRTKVVRSFQRKGTAKAILDGWLIHYNFFRPNSALPKGKTPAEAAEADSPYRNWKDVVEK